MLIALSGTPGTGKTTVAHYLEDHGITTFSLNHLALSHKFTDGKDVIRGSYILDLDKINTYIKKEFSNLSEPTIIEGHAAHWLTEPQWVIILRCHPSVLRKRLMAKKWNKHKIEENVEAEILDVILCEATEIHHSHHLLEIDTTEQAPQQIGKIILNQIENGFSDITDFCVGAVDWSEEILKEPE